MLDAEKTQQIFYAVAEACTGYAPQIEEDDIVAFVEKCKQYPNEPVMVFWKEHITKRATC